MPKITLGQEFGSLAEFKTYLRAWAVEDGFSPAILDSDAKRVRVGCRTGSDCTFRIRCNFDQEENKAKVSTLVANHTCQKEQDPESTQVIRGEVTKLRFLLDAVPHLMVIDRATPTKDIIENVKNRYGQQISMRQAQKVKSALLLSASELLGRDFQDRMRAKLDEHATVEEIRRGKRLRLDNENIDPSLYEDANNHDYQDEDQYQEYQEDDMDDRQPGYEDDYVGETESPTDHDPRFDQAIDNVSQPESNLEQIWDQTLSHNGPSAAKLRAEAASLFQQASAKFQEATRLHMQASKLFSQATEIEHQQG